MKSAFAFVAVATSIAAAIACSTSSGNGADAGAGTCTGRPGASTNAACTTCVQTNCGGEISAFDSACSDYVTCVCADGGVSCLAKAMESGCDSAGANLSMCQQTNCTSACTTTSADSGGDS